MLPRCPTRWLLTLSLLATIASCGAPMDPRCNLSPDNPKLISVCATVVGYYRAGPFWDRQCRSASGCSCDATCRATRIPFTSEEECELACSGDGL